MNTPERCLRRPAAAVAAAALLALLLPLESSARTPTRIDRAGSAVPTASITIDCGGGKKITLGTGGSGGSCTSGDGIEGAHASCSVDGRQVAAATCVIDCLPTVGGGTCAVTR